MGVKIHVVFVSCDQSFYATNFAVTVDCKTDKVIS